MRRMGKRKLFLQTNKPKKNMGSMVTQHGDCKQIESRKDMSYIKSELFFN